jgi:hypothetical protein
MCFDHHDEYDSTTRISKGLREREVRRWRDELYKEMQYRFRTIKTRSLELKATGLVGAKGGDGFKAVFRLTNTGETEVRSPMVSFRLAPGMQPTPPRESPAVFYKQKQEDFFEAGGKVAVIHLLGAINPILIPGHSAPFEFLYFPLSEYPLGSVVFIEYRIDGEEVTPVKGKFEVTVPATKEELYVIRS